MLMVVLAALVGSAQTPVARDIDTLCASEPTCVATQRQSAKHFIGIAVAFDATKADAERCMRAAKTNAGLIDWTIAEQCLRNWSEGKETLLPGGGK